MFRDCGNQTFDIRCPHWLRRSLEPRQFGFSQGEHFAMACDARSTPLAIASVKFATSRPQLNCRQSISLRRRSLGLGSQQLLNFAANFRMTGARSSRLMPTSKLLATTVRLIRTSLAQAASPSFRPQ
jgi:hypothetical protein